MSATTAGDITAFGAMTGRMLRPVGGWIADRLGGFALPLLLGGLKGATGSFAPGFGVLATVAVVALASVFFLMTTDEGWRWRRRTHAGGLEIGSPTESAA